MIDKTLLDETVKKAIQGTPLFLVETRVEPGNRIVVEVDSAQSVDIDECAALSREIEKAFDRDVEDYELEVGSAGLTSPFKVREQFLKNIGNEVEVMTTDNHKFKGELTEATEDSFTILCEKKVKEEGKKRPVIVKSPLTIAYPDAKSVKCVLNFK